MRHVHVNGRSAASLAIATGAGYEHTYDTAYRDQQTHLEAELAMTRNGLEPRRPACTERYNMSRI